MKLKLRIFLISKLSSFAHAMYKMTTHQMKQQQVLARCIKKWEISSTAEELNGRSEEQDAGGSQSRSDFMQNRDEYSRGISS